MTPDQITEAITKAFLEGGQQWLVLTIAAFMPALWAFTLMLHLARPYVIRTLRKLSLRFGADVWWLTYVLIHGAATNSWLQRTLAIERGGPKASAPMQALIRAGQELSENRPLHSSP